MNAVISSSDAAMLFELAVAVMLNNPANLSACVLDAVNEIGGDGRMRVISEGIYTHSYVRQPRMCVWRVS